jgi:hypothetical protein
MVGLKSPPFGCQHQLSIFCRVAHLCPPSKILNDPKTEKPAYETAHFIFFKVTIGLKKWGRE